MLGPLQIIISDIIMITQSDITNCIHSRPSSHWLLSFVCFCRLLIKYIVNIFHIFTNISSAAKKKIKCGYLCVAPWLPLTTSVMATNQSFVTTTSFHSYYSISHYHYQCCFALCSEDFSTSVTMDSNWTTTTMMLMIHADSFDWSNRNGQLDVD